MSVKPNRPPLPRLAVWSAGLGVSFSILAVGFIAWGMSDVDGDGEPSLQEIGDGSRPMKADSDGDGVSDGWEKANGFDPMTRDQFDSFASPVEQDPLCEAGLKSCPEPSQSAEQPQAPKVSDQTAQLRTGLIALGVAAAAAVAGLFTARSIRA